MSSRSARVQSAAISGALLIGWAALCFWVGLNFAVVAAILLLAALLPLSLLAGHRFIPRRFVYAEIAVLGSALIACAISGFSFAAVTVFGALLALDTALCSLLTLAKGHGAMRNATRNLIIILAACALGAGASSVASVFGSVPSCGVATVGNGGATDQRSAAAGQCFVASAENCEPHALTVRDMFADEWATHSMRITREADTRCDFTDTVHYGPPSSPGRFTVTYACPTLTDQVGAPGEQQVQLSQCSGAILTGAAAPIIPMNPYRPLPAVTPVPG